MAVNEAGEQTRWSLRTPSHLPLSHDDGYLFKVIAKSKEAWNPLVVLWLGLCASMAGRTGSVPGRERIRSHMLCGTSKNPKIPQLK